MGLADDLKEEVKGIFSETWEVSEAEVVPDPESLKLSNDARHFERATILYADLSGSTNLVDKYHWKKAGKIYKSYLACAARIIRSLGGEITAYDGDRVMAVFIGDMQTTKTAKCAVKIKWALKKTVKTTLKDSHKNTTGVKTLIGIVLPRVPARR